MGRACGLARRDSISNNEVHGRYGMDVRAEAVACGVVEWAKRKSLIWQEDMSS